MTALLIAVVVALCLSCSERPTEPQRNDAVEFANWVKKNYPEVWISYPPHQTAIVDSLQ